MNSDGREEGNLKETAHIPVLLHEVLTLFNPQRGETYFDGTVNGGGHTRAILERVGKEGKVIGFDWDCDLINRLKKQYPENGHSNLELVCENYADAKKIFAEKGWGAVHGILLDIGFSSYHIEHSGRGFSFRKDEDLDMRYSDKGGRVRASDIVNLWEERELARIVRELGEERFADRIARAIVQARKKKPIITSGDLTRVIEESVPYSYRKAKIHPATRTFQALRIAVNEELDNLSRFLVDAEEMLRPGGTIIIISFHSLEDRIVKAALKSKEKAGVLKIFNKKVVRASQGESRENPRARSAKLRAAIKV